MRPHLLFFMVLFLLSGLSESQHLSSVTKVSVQRGQTITIPFLYGQMYKHHKKFCQRGTTPSAAWSADVHNGKQTNSQTMSMCDDVTKSIFTLTVRMDVGVKYTDEKIKKYICAVNAGGPHNENIFKLLDTEGTPELHVQNQTVSGHQGGDVVVECLYRNPSGEKKWCRIGGSCLKAGEVDGMSVETADEARVFRVTLRNLQQKNSGWYWCSVGEFQMPVHITVSKKTIPHTTTIITQTTPTTDMSLNISNEISECISILNPKKEIWILGLLLKFAVALVCLTLSVITAVKLLKLRAAVSKDDGTAPDPSAE